MCRPSGTANCLMSMNIPMMSLLKPVLKQDATRMPRIVLFGIVLFATALALLSIACGAEPLPTATPTPAPTSTPIPTATPPPTATSTPKPTLAPTPAPLVFLPEDEAPHDAPVEWWYFNGMLTDDEGREYSYHFVTFQTPGPTGVTPHLLQATLGRPRPGRPLLGRDGTAGPGEARRAGCQRGQRRLGDARRWAMAMSCGWCSVKAETTRRWN